MKNIKKILLLGIGFFIMVVILYVSGIGCPIKFFTGVSCPGCGMSRAYMSVFKLDFAKAFYYHPLFLIVPIVVIMFIFSERIPKEILDKTCIIFIVLLMGVYVIRLLSGPEDVISINIKQGIIFKMLSNI